jgi:hypothetical protein
MRRIYFGAHAISFVPGAPEIYSLAKLRPDFWDTRYNEEHSYSSCILHPVSGSFLALTAVITLLQTFQIPYRVTQYNTRESTDTSGNGVTEFPGQ